MISKRAALLAALLGASLPADAAFLSGEALDTAADVLAWIVIVLVPIVAIVVFWLVHILPEKIAEHRHHPQQQAIKTLCLLSLVFGGMLWPIAWLWAYTRPVMFRMAYGTERHESYFEEAAAKARVKAEKARAAAEASPSAPAASAIPTELQRAIAAEEAEQAGSTAKSPVRPSATSAGTNAAGSRGIRSMSAGPRPPTSGSTRPRPPNADGATAATDRHPSADGRSSRVDRRSRPNDQAKPDPGQYIGRKPERAAETIPGGVRPDDERVAAHSTQSGPTSPLEPSGHREGEPADDHRVREAGQDR